MEIRWIHGYLRPHLLPCVILPRFCGTVVHFPVRGGSGASINEDETLKNDNLGGALAIEKDYGKNWRLSAGARVLRDDVTFTQMVDVFNRDSVVLFGNRLPTILTDAEGSVTELDGKLDDTAVTWRVALDFIPNDNLLVYGSVATGYKPGGCTAGWRWTRMAELEVGPRGFVRSQHQDDLADVVVLGHRGVPRAQFIDIHRLALVASGTFAGLHKTPCVFRRTQQVCRLKPSRKFFRRDQRDGLPAAPPTRSLHQIVPTRLRASANAVVASKSVPSGPHP